MTIITMKNLNNQETTKFKDLKQGEFFIIIPDDKYKMPAEGLFCITSVFIDRKEFTRVDRPDNWKTDDRYFDNMDVRRVKTVDIEFEV